MLEPSPPLRPVGVVLGGGTLTGAFAGFATGAIDAAWSWSAAGQFLPGIGRLRFIAFTAFEYAFVGLVLGFAITAAALPLARASRARQLLQFALRVPREPGVRWQPWVAFAIGTAIAGAVLSTIAARSVIPFVTGRKELGLAVLVAFGAGVLVAIASAWLGAVLGRFIERGFGARQPLPAWARSERSSTSALALAIAAVPIAGIVLYLGYRIGVGAVVGRKDPAMGPVVSLAFALAGGAVLVACVVTFAVGRVLEPVAAKLPRPRWAPAIAAAGLFALAVAVGLVVYWDTAKLLPLRVPAVVILAGAMTVATWRPSFATAIRLRDRSPVIRRAVFVALFVALFALVLALGGNDAVIKAGARYTGIAGTLSRVLRAPFDFDRDGYARFLGGGDCDDGDRSIHPGAMEIPDDGIDQNCIGGDPSASPAPTDVGFAPVPASVPPDFRVLLITIDTVRADHFGMYGYARKTSPNLDALAGQGTVFEHGWAHAPSTRYSIPAILTGRLPLDVRYDYSVQGWPGLSDKATTIAEALGPTFHSGAITNYWYFDKSRHMDQGMAEYDNSNARLHASVSGAGPEQTKGSSSKEQTDKAIAFVDRNADKRWFLWVHYYDPHYAYEPHQGVPNFGADEEALYDGEIAYTDQHIGRLLDHLKSTGAYDKTVVVVTGDHGEGFGEHDIKLHGYHLYAAQTKVPLIVRVPGLAGRRSATPAGHIDLLPTLVNLAGGKPSSEMMGHSLVDALQGTSRERLVVQQLSYENNNEMRAAADGQCHVIYNVSPNTSWEVYRTDRDPQETDDLDGSDECAATRDQFERWYDRSMIPPGAAEALLPSRPALAKTIDADFGDAVLLACEAPATANKGESIDITWTFEARTAVEPGWKMFAHVTGPNRGTFVNGDHTPARPFEWWKPGQFIRYTTSITLPKTAVPGRYAITAGMFKGTSRRPVKTSAPVADNAVTCATFEVQP